MQTAVVCQSFLLCAICTLHGSAHRDNHQDNQLVMWSSYCKAKFSTHWKYLVCRFNKLNCRSCITNLHSSHRWISGYGKSAYNGQINFLWLITFFWVFCLNSFLVFLKVILMLRYILIMLVFCCTSYILRLLMFFKKFKREITRFLKADMKTRMYILRTKMKKLYWCKNKY